MLTYRFFYDKWNNWNEIQNCLFINNIDECESIVQSSTKIIVYIIERVYTRVAWKTKTQIRITINRTTTHTLSSSEMEDNPSWNLAFVDKRKEKKKKKQKNSRYHFVSTIAISNIYDRSSTGDTYPLPRTYTITTTTIATTS